MHFKNTFKVYLKYNYYEILDGPRIYLKHTGLNYFLVLQTLQIKISPKVHLKYTSYLEYRSIFEVQFNFSRTKLTKVYITSEQLPSG